MKDLRRIHASPDNSILMVIDMDNETNRTVGGLPEPHPELSEKSVVIPVVRRLIDSAHEAGVQVIYVQSVRNHREAQFTVFKHNPIRKIGARDSRIVDELTPEPRDIVVRKWNHDPWYQTDLERILDGLTPEPTQCQVLITGGGGTGCAFFGANGFYVRNFQTVLILDGMYHARTVAARNFSRTSYPTFPNVYLSRSDLIEFSTSPERLKAGSSRGVLAAGATV